MTRRLVAAIVGAVLVTVVLVGAGTLVLANVRARHTTERELRADAADVAANLTDVVVIDGTESAAQLLRRFRLLQAFANTLPIGDLAVLTFVPGGGAAGELEGDGLPPGITVGDLRPERLARLEVVSGNVGNTVYAAAPTEVAGSRRIVVVVLTRRANAGLGASVRYFLLAAALTLVLGIVVAMLLARRLTRPIRDASAVTQRIAAGELATRLPAPGPDQHDELAELSRSINDMAEGLQREQVLEQQFLLSVSHDLRTPLTSIRGYAEAITDGAAEPQAAAAVIRSEARRLERLVADLLDLAKLQSRSFSLHVGSVDLAAAASTAIAAFAPEAAERGITLRTASAAGATTPRLLVEADADRLAQVIANLIENSLRYARASVLVTTEATVGHVLLTVDDDGPGISAADLPHVFDRLYVARAHPRRAESSSGLGLAIVRELVEAHGGTVGAGASPMGGARMWIRLPSSRLEAPTTLASPPPPPPATAPPV